MADRNVREPDQALAQRLTRLEERVRALSLRAWPGAVRTASTGSVVLSTAVLTPVVSVTVVAGRWVVFGDTTVQVNPIDDGGYNLQVWLAAYDASTGVALSGGDYQLGRRVHYRAPVTAGSDVHEPMFVIGHFVSDRVVTVTLSAVNYQSDVSTAYDSRLLLLPV